MNTHDQARPIGLIAGGGAAPVEIARSITSRGRDIFVVAIRGDADPVLLAYPHAVLGWSELGRAIAALKNANVADVLMVGTMARPKLSTARIDLSFLRFLPDVLRILRQGGDDALLRTVIRLFESQGFRAVGVRDVAPDLLMPAGALGAIEPAAGLAADIALGLRLIASLGRFDIGQGAIVSRGEIEAIEGAEGTDKMLARVEVARRAAETPMACRRGVLVKRTKPGQDLRVDLPAIGPGTATSVAAAGLEGIAAMRGHVLTAQRSDLIARADAAGIFVCGVEAPVSAEEPSADAEPSLIELGAVTLDGAARADAVLGVRVLAALGAFRTGSALVARRRRIMAIGASESAIEVLRREALANARGPNSRRGVAIIGGETRVDEALIAEAAKAGVAAVVALRAVDASERPRLAAAANSLRLALVAASVCGGEAAS